MSVHEHHALALDVVPATDLGSWKGSCVRRSPAQGAAVEVPNDPNAGHPESGREIPKR
jgi:hypothetical protein